MKTIPKETIEKYWHERNTQSDENVIYQELKELYHRQPLLMNYVMVAEKESLNEDERRMLYYLGTFLVQVMLKEFTAAPDVTEKEWEKARESNLNMLGFLASEETAEHFRSSMDVVIDAQHQADLLRFILETLMHDPLCQRTIREENVWKLFTHLKIVIDCLDKRII